MLKRIVVLFLICFTATFTLAGVQKQTDVKGFVVNVTSDCLLVVSIDHEAEIVRLAGVAYANDQGKPNGGTRDFIRAMVLNKSVRIEELGEDQRGDILGRIYVDKNCLNEALIQAGLAKPVR